MRQIHDGLGYLFKPLPFYLIEQKRQHDGRREKENKIHQADNHRVAQNRQKRCLGEQFHELLKAYPLADGLYWLYSMNAILKPNMGTYLKIAKNKIPGISRKYSQRYFTISLHVV